MTGSCRERSGALRLGILRLSQLPHRAAPHHAPAVAIPRASPQPVHWLILHLLREAFCVSWCRLLNRPMLSSLFIALSPDPRSRDSPLQRQQAELY